MVSGLWTLSPVFREWLLFLAHYNERKLQGMNEITPRPPVSIPPKICVGHPTWPQPYRPFSIKTIQVIFYERIGFS